MKTKHTPGPWHLIETASMMKNGDVTIMLANKSPHIHGILYGVKNDADLRLIAAAPEMLEALELVIIKLDVNRDQKMIEVIDLIINKARGEK